LNTKSNASLRSDITQALHYAPTTGSPTAPGLLAVKIDELVVCYKCLGRLYGRGMGHLVKSGSQVWSDQLPSGSALACDTCGHFEVAE
jgi:hypothetical protein